MALYKSHSITLDTKRTPKIALQNIVVGETGNKLTVTLKNDGSTVSLNGTDYRVCLRVDSAKGVVRQDSSLPNSGITFSSGKVIIMLSRDSFAASLNRCRLEIFSTETDTDDILICSSEFQFTAESNDTGENAGEVYPSLVLAEQEARQATEDANDAADAANAAAAELNELLDNIDSTPTANSTHLVTSGGVHLFVANKINCKGFITDNIMGGIAPGAGYGVGDYYIIAYATGYQHKGVALKAGDVLMCYTVSSSPTWNDFEVVPIAAHIPVSATSTPVMDGSAAVGSSAKFAKEDHVHPSDTSKQDVLTFDNSPTSGSDNPVKSKGIYSALALKQDALTFDDTPTFNSENPVTSGGVASAIASFAPMVLRIVPQWDNPGSVNDTFSYDSNSGTVPAFSGATLSEIVQSVNNKVPITVCMTPPEEEETSWANITQYVMLHEVIAVIGSDRVEANFGSNNSAYSAELSLVISNAGECIQAHGSYTEM